MDIVLSLMLFIVGAALFGVAAWRSFETNVGGAVERNRAVAQTAAIGLIALVMVVVACSVFTL